MIFKFYTSGGCTFLEAIFEDTDHLTSQRLEGIGVDITNRNPLVFFNKEYKYIHPDIIALACLAIFYPFIGSKVTFPEAITQALADSINRPIFLKHKKLEIQNINANLKRYEGEHGEVLAFGGGIDSTAIKILFPNAFVVHEASVKNGILVPDNANTTTLEFETRGQGVLVETNSRYISNPGGWHVWIGSIVTSLLEAGKRRAKYIYAGTILGAAFLANGIKYFDRHTASKWHGVSGNYWQQLFWDIGIPLVQPLMGCSEILTMQAALRVYDFKDINYCTANNGSPCEVCDKCFRRTCIKSYIDNKHTDFELFDNNLVKNTINRNPLYMGHIYTSLMSDGWTPPSFAKDRFELLPKNNSFALGFNPESLEFIPDELKDKVNSVLHDNFRPMSNDEIIQMKEWDQLKS